MRKSSLFFLKIMRRSVPPTAAARESLLANADPVKGIFFDIGIIFQVSRTSDGTFLR